MIFRNFPLGFQDKSYGKRFNNQGKYWKSQTRKLNNQKFFCSQTIWIIEFPLQN